MIKINANGTITVVTEVDASNEILKALLNTIIRAEHTDGDTIHMRWSVLYNAYDMMYNCDIREKHKVRGSNKSLVAWMGYTGKLGKLLMVASKIYPHEFELYSEIEGGVY